jgi:hypothetical protein
VELTVENPCVMGELPVFRWKGEARAEYYNVYLECADKWLEPHPQDPIARVVEPPYILGIDLPAAEYRWKVAAVMEKCPLGKGGALSATASVQLGGKPFRRGDVDDSGVVDISDPINNLTFQFLGAFTPTCKDALDDDDSGVIDISDPIYSLTRQFLGGPPQPAPGPDACGVDPTCDKDDQGNPADLGCEKYDLCN